MRITFIRLFFIVLNVVFLSASVITINITLVGCNGGAKEVNASEKEGYPTDATGQEIDNILGAEISDDIEKETNFELTAEIEKEITESENELMKIDDKEKDLEDITPDDL